MAATTAASMSPSRGPLVTTRMWIDVTRPRRLSGVSSWTRLERKTAEKTSAAPAIARHRSASGNDTVTSPKAVIASPQARTATRIARPVCRTDLTQPEKSAPRNAPAAGAAAISPNPAAPVWNTSSARTGKSDVGIPKTIALKSITNVPRMARLPPGEAQPLADGVEPRPRDDADRRQRLDGEQGDERRHERDEVDRVGAGQPDRRDEDAADRRPDDRGHLVVELVERDGRRQALGRDEARDGRRARRLVDRGQAGRQEGDGEQGRDRRGALQRQDDQHERARGETRLGRHQQAPPVDRIGERAGAQREQQDRDELEERERRDREGRPGQDVDLVRQRDAGDLVADAVDDLAGPQPAVVTIEAERGRVEEKAADASIHPVAAGDGRPARLVDGQDERVPVRREPGLTREVAGDDRI